MKLNELHKSFVEIPFPQQNGISDELSDIYFELADYDGYISGKIDSIIAKKKITLNEITYDTQLEDRLNSFLSKTEKDQPDHVTAVQMRSYLLQIKMLIDQARLEIEKM